MKEERKKILNKIYEELEGVSSVYLLYRIYEIIKSIKKSAPFGGTLKK